MLKPKINTKETLATFPLTIAFPSIGGIAIVTGHAALAVCPRRQVPTVLAHAAVHTPAVAITLTRWEQIIHTNTE